MMWAMKKAMLLFGLVAAAAGGVTGETISLSTMLDEMLDRDAVTRFPDPCYKMRLWSSHDRRSVAADRSGWFANWDMSKFERVETNAEGEVEHVMVDAKGPGALVRAWVTGHASAVLPLRIYVDGQLVLEGIANQLVGGTNVCAAPLSQGYPVEPGERRGFNLFLPIPYAKGLKVVAVADQPIADDASVPSEKYLYYNFETRTWPQGTAVEGLTKATLAAAAGKIAAVNAALARSDEPLPAGETETFDGTLAAGCRKAVALKGPGAIRYLQLRAVTPLDKDVFMWLTEEAELADLEIELAFDGKTTAKMPVGEFFNVGLWDANPHATRFTSAADLVLASRWVMPFATSATVTLRNTGDRPVVLSRTKLVKGAYAWNARSMHFGATYVPRPDAPTRIKGSPYDLTYEDLRGSGVQVGSTTAVDNPARGWWGEGDEKIWVDGEKSPSFIGTGTEDYYCYAWCREVPFSHPFFAQPAGDGNGVGNAVGGYTVNFRARVLDAIPFTRSLRFDMELWSWKNTRMRYDTVAWHYLLPAR